MAAAVTTADGLLTFEVACPWHTVKPHMEVVVVVPPWSHFAEPGAVSPACSHNTFLMAGCTKMRPHGGVLVTKVLLPAVAAPLVAGIAALWPPG